MHNWELSMISVDAVIIGGGISGLLIASALSATNSVIVVEQNQQVPRNKYWLTDHVSLAKNPLLKDCVDRQYAAIDFIAYDGLIARVCGRYCLWDTDKLISKLVQEIERNGARILTGYRFYTYSVSKSEIRVRVNTEVIHARVLIDCMGFNSPIVGAKNIASISGYYILHGRQVKIFKDVTPIALHNILIAKNPTFFELFPTSRETAHAALILPSRHFKPHRSLHGELRFILERSEYSECIERVESNQSKAYFGIIPVGRLRTSALDRIVFFGEAGQINPAASATGLTKMLRVYREFAERLSYCIRKDKLDQSRLVAEMPRHITTMNRIFQEKLFDSLLDFTSDDFRYLVQELKRHPDEIINDLIFADYDFGVTETIKLTFDATRHGRNILGSHIIRAIISCAFRTKSV